MRIGTVSCFALMFCGAVSPGLMSPGLMSPGLMFPALMGCNPRPADSTGPTTATTPGGDPAMETAAAVSSGERSQDKALAAAPPASPTAGTSAKTAPLPRNVAPVDLPTRHPEHSNMLLVPAGAFTMGADSGGEGDERPAHEVTLGAFYLDETEVTNAAYNDAVAAGVCKAPYPKSAQANGYGKDKRFRGPQQPISSISWDNAKAYCEWRGLRLPSEAEWEKAARGPDKGRLYPWGNDKPSNKIHGRFGAGVTADVGSYPAGAGPYGHLDMAGNVWEWIADDYDPVAYTRATAADGIPGTCKQTLAAFDELRRTNSQGFTGSNPIPTGCERVLRGGAFNYHAAGLRVTNRVHHPARYRLVMSGMRCALSAKVD